MRIVSMLMVLMLHVLGKGGILSIPRYTLKYEIVWFMEIAAYGAVDCYALISGYVGVFSKCKYGNLALLWLRVVFYSAGISIIYKVISPENVGNGQLLLSFFPVLTNMYWYFSSYFLLFLFMPLLNSILNNVDKKRLSVTLIIIVFLTSIVLPVSSIVGRDVWQLSNGYSPLWLMILYLIGGYIRKYGFLNRIKTFWFGIFYFLSVTITWISMGVIQIITKRIFSTVKYDEMWISYLSITVLASAVSLLLLFERVKISKPFCRLVSFVSSLAFSVYLIHCQPIILKLFISDHFTWYTDLPVITMVLMILGSVLVIFILCLLIDLFRAFLFKVLKLRIKINCIEQRLKMKLSCILKS